ncbi:hypothetical protein ACH5RR_040618 [Cinchona calisaya]|uniref:MADS-box domain-containing protein n=1 Tax=Cinchona calisaya TaxID=153742 RepID=A0ABD2XS33_9GENT
METNLMKKKQSGGCGRRKIEIKKIEKKKSLLVTFSKRRASLFKKVEILSNLSGANIAIIVQSPGGKIFAAGAGAPINSILARYLAAVATSSSNSSGSSIINVDEDFENSKKCVEFVENNNNKDIEDWIEEYMGANDAMDDLGNIMNC